MNSGATADAPANETPEKVTQLPKKAPENEDGTKKPITDQPPPCTASKSKKRALQGNTAEKEAGHSPKHANREKSTVEKNLQALSKIRTLYEKTKTAFTELLAVIESKGEWQWANNIDMLKPLKSADSHVKAHANDFLLRF